MCYIYLSHYHSNQVVSVDREFITHACKNIDIHSVMGACFVSDIALGNEFIAGNVLGMVSAFLELKVQHSS
jgi:hypothetical protein